MRAQLVKSRLTLRDPVDYSLPGSSVHEIFQGRILEWVAIPFSRGSSRPRDPTHISYPPSIRVFSNESTLHMRWPKYWSFSPSIIPSKEIPGLISFRMDWLDLLAAQGTLGLRGTAGGCARVTAGPKRPHLGVCPGPNSPLHHFKICTLFTLAFFLL